VLAAEPWPTFSAGDRRPRSIAGNCPEALEIGTVCEGWAMGTVANIVAVAEYLE
jgi:hypothetical protein